MGTSKRRRRKTMASFNYQLFEEAAKELYIRALTVLPPDVRQALKKAFERETNPAAKETLRAIMANVEVVDKQKVLMCQDTGLPLYMVKIGDKFPVEGGRLLAAINEGAKRAIKEYPLRPSAAHPITRIIPESALGEGLPIIHLDFDPNSEFLEILMSPVAASEYRSAMKVFAFSDGMAAVKKFIIDFVVESGATPCPPGIIGVGIGGTADLATKLAKKATTRPVDSRNADPVFAKLEDELLDAINSLGIGPMGLGGDVSALAVHIEWANTQIFLIPVAVNTQCWPARRARARIFPNGNIEYGF
jgi:fumarate hydratase subunit alpha